MTNFNNNLIKKLKVEKFILLKLRKSRRLIVNSLLVLLSLFIIACNDPQPKITNEPNIAETETDKNLKANDNEQVNNYADSQNKAHEQVALDSLATTTPPSTRNKPLEIDWTQLDSNVKAVDKAKFDYVFEPDGPQVTSYIKLFHVSPLDAQHSLTVGMASNEPLDALLTQLGDSYLSHKLTDGSDPKLIIHTTQNVQASEFNYVISNEFAKGLVLPIVINPASKPIVNTDKKSDSDSIDKTQIK